MYGKRRQRRHVRFPLPGLLWLCLLVALALALAGPIATASAQGGNAPDHLFTGTLDACPGTWVAGACWFFDDHNDSSCNNVCGGYGSYSSVTARFAGSAGNNAACAQVLTALTGGTVSVTGNPSTVGGVAGLGCGAVDGETPVRVSSPTTALAESPGFARACACRTGSSSAPVAIDYPDAPLQLTQGVAMTPALPLVTGEAIAFEVSPFLPVGLQLDPDSGTIGGTPAAPQPASNYQVTVYATTGSAATSISIGVQAATACGSGGAGVGGLCWYLGSEELASCTQVCAGNGGYHDGTASYAGSGGSNAQCQQVLTGLGVFSGTLDNTDTLNGVAGLGCGLYGTMPYRLTSPTTAGAMSTVFRRACACNG